MYLDDILIYSRTPSEHLKHIESVLKTLHDNKLYAKMSKCSFNRKEIKFLGHIISADGVKVNPAKIAAVAEWAVPTTKVGLQAFLGLANYFRKFIQGFSTIAAPLYDCVTATHGKKHTALGAAWNKDCQAAFEKLKVELTHAPVLHLPNEELPYEVVCDASCTGTGAVLMQAEHPVAYLSHKFSAAEKNYTTGEQELLAVIRALTEWRCYLEGCTGGLVLITDHHPLVYLQTQAVLSRKQARWLEFLSRFHPYQWKHIPGRVNVADPLSRVECESPVCAVILRRDATPDKPILSDILQGYSQDKWFTEPSNVQTLEHTPQGYWVGTVASDALPSQIVVPNIPDLKSRILQEFHDKVSSGHTGTSRTVELVSRHYWWPGMLLDISDYVKSCISCQRSKPGTGTHPVAAPLPVPTERWASVSMDFITSLPKSRGYDTIMVVVDRLSKMVILIPTHVTATADKVAKLFVSHVVSKHGVPVQIISDRDSRFTSHFWRATCRIWGTSQGMSTAFRPQTDGQTERTNRIIEETLRHYINDRQSNWVDLLPMAEFAINNAYNSSTQSSAFFLNYGQHPLEPANPGPFEAVPEALDFTTRISEALRCAKEALERARDRYISQTLTNKAPIAYTVGQLVFLSSKNLSVAKGFSKKLLPKWMGPFEVLRTVVKGQTVVAVQLQLPDGWSIHDVFHVSLIRPYRADGTYQPPPPDSSWVTAAPSCTILKVLDQRTVSHAKRAKLEYLVKWSGDNDRYPTWEPAQSVLTAYPELVSQYEAQLPQPSPEVARRTDHPMQLRRHPTLGSGAITDE
jgi:hypothetical protein